MEVVDTFETEGEANCARQSYADAIPHFIFTVVPCEETGLFFLMEQRKALRLIVNN